METWYRTSSIVFFIAILISGFQCEGNVRGRVTDVTGSYVIAVFRAEDSVKVGEKFSLWRDEWQEKTKSTATFRVGIIEVIEVHARNTAIARIVMGNPKTGDKVTKWLIEK